MVLWDIFSEAIDVPYLLGEDHMIYLLPLVLTYLEWIVSSEPYISRHYFYITLPAFCLFHFLPVAIFENYALKASLYGCDLDSYHEIFTGSEIAS